MSTGTHKECGEDIIWAKRDDDENRFAPPLEFAGPAYIVDNRGVGIQIMTYRRHHCDPEKVAAWQEYKQRIAELDHSDPQDIRVERQAARAMRQAARDEKREAHYEYAAKVDCPSCGAEAGEACEDLAKQKKGLRVQTRWPHESRVSVADKRQKGMS